MKHTTLYTADVHGNEVQYKKLVGHALEVSASTVIIGGDILPKGFPARVYIKAQRAFIERRLPGLVKPLEKSGCRLFLMMGNDDCSSNLDSLARCPHLYTIIHNNRVRVGGVDLVGYSNVPITPFSIKDWEKFDLSHAPKTVQREYDQRKRTNYRLQGFKSSRNGWERFNFSPEMEALDSIQKDLSGKLFTKDPEKTILVVHTLPDNTCLDQLHGGYHVGSFALRLFIEKFQPRLTLHGHIHETVEVSGQFKQRIGRTLCMVPGNHNIGNQLALLSFDLRDPQGIKRLTI